jgi:Flp pilus assembly protein TadD
MLALARKVRAMKKATYEDMCFVIMPFGQRKIGDREYNFDEIYANVFQIAISMASLPDGIRLVPKRADTPSTPGLITQEMFRDILYARIVLADITGLNPNVFYELGVRHALRPLSTVVFKEVHSTIPFDVRDLRIFDYNLEGLAGFGGAIQGIRKSLEDSLTAGTLDSPVVAALRDEIEWPTVDIATQAKYKLRSWLESQKERAAVDAYVREAQSAIERRDLAAAVASLRGALALVPDDLNVNMDLARLLRDKGDFTAVESILTRVTGAHPAFEPAWRELGIAQHKLKKATDAVPTLRRATGLNEYDADAWGALGGVLKTLQQYGESQDAYLKSLHLNPSDPYALLNYVAVYAQNNRALPDLKPHETEIQQAESTCRTEITMRARLPWCHFDLAQILFLRADDAGFREQFREGAKAATARWQVEAAAKTYVLLHNSGIGNPDAGAANGFANEVLKEFWKDR